MFIVAQCFSLCEIDYVLYTSFIRQKDGSKHKRDKRKNRACANYNHSWF